MGIIINGQDDSIKAVDGTGTVELTATHATTATTATSATTAGTATTATNALNIKDSDGNVKLSTNSTGMVMTGITTVTSGKLMVGNAYIDRTAIGVGQTDTTGRDAGIGTMTGSMIFNTTTSSVQVWDGSTWQEVSNKLSGMTATGGVINDYTESGPGKVIRSHTFKSSGTFVVSQLSTNLPNSVDYLVVAGGGAGGAYGGGGAGGLRSSHPSMPAPLKGEAITVTAQTYPVTVGAGAGGFTNNDGMDGNNSVFSTITSNGGGGGGGDADPGPGTPGRSGGSGGGANRHYTPYGPRPAGAGNTPPTTPPQGNPGGAAPINAAGGGGGGASEAGEDTTGSIPGFAGKGGDGLLVSITGVSTHYAGGGGGGAASPGGTQRGLGGAGGGGNGHEWPAVQAGSSGAEGTGGGGGGGGNGALSNIPATWNKMYGGSGIVVLSYQIGNQDTETAKATGGNISFSGGQTIHQFLSSGTFTITDSSLTSCTYLVVAGGGGGGAMRSSTSFATGGGGGAGGFLTGSLALPPGSYTITVGGGGVGGQYQYDTGTNGAPSSIAHPGITDVTSQGGGAGAAWGSPAHAAIPGGSGGGGGAGAAGSGDKETGTSNPATPGQGNAGGSGNASPPGYGAGGGGGAGGVGANGTTTAGGNGGAGLPSTISGVNVTYAGGGGGGSYAGNTVGTGGAGGGGPAVLGSKGTNATTNTGGGGGGGTSLPSSPWVNPLGIGGDGGSGIVIIAYPT